MDLLIKIKEMGGEKESKSIDSTIITILCQI